MNSKITGNKGEKIAANFLESKGYKIIDRNFSFRSVGGPKIAEIDIIAKKGGCFVFAEVKTIYANDKFLAQDKVNQVKKWKIAKAAEFWLIKNKIPLNSKWQIDVIAVELQEDGRYEIIKKVFGPKCKISHFQNVSSY